ncbi:hypothetical protein [Caballeronia sp. M23-90]
MTSIYSKKDHRAKINHIEFSDFDQIEYEVGRRAVRMYGHLRFRGHARFAAFVAAFGDKLGGHPDRLTNAAADFETSPTYAAMYAAIESEYAVEEARNHWEKRAVAQLHRSGGAFSLKSDVSKKYHISYDVEEIETLLADVRDEVITNTSDNFVSLEEHMSKVHEARSEQMSRIDPTEGLRMPGEGSLAIFK